MHSIYGIIICINYKRKIHIMPNKTYTASDITAYIINMSDAYDINNLKLQKLLYLCQREYLKKYNRPLFKDKIVAWQYGPCIPSIYHVYSYRGASRIHKALPRKFIPTFSIYGQYKDIELHKLDIETEQLINNVLRTYGEKSPWDLVNETNHRNTAWYKVYKPDDDYNPTHCGDEITIQDIMYEIENTR